MHESQKYCGELTELTVDDIWQIADAGDQEEDLTKRGGRKGEGSVLYTLRVLLLHIDKCS